MNKIIILFVCLLIGVFTLVDTGKALTAKNVVRLKNAGVSDQTIQVIIQEKVIETAAFSIEEIVEMKNAGVGEKTLQMLVKEGSFLKKADVVVYGESTHLIRFTTARDVIELKQAGMSDEVIQAIIAVSGERYYSQQEEAFELLRDMDIVVDTRRRSKRYTTDR